MEIKLINIGKHKIEVIKLIRLFSGLSLKESKELTDIIPSTFSVKNTKIKFEQIKKNFTAIGAIIEKIEPIKPIVKKIPVKKDVSNVPGEDLSEKTPFPKKTTKTKHIKNRGKSISEKHKFSDKKNEKNQITDKLFNLNQKADDLFFLKSVKSAIKIAIVGAAIFAISNFYFPFSSFFVFLIIGLAIAITFRSTNRKTSVGLGVLSVAFTSLSFIIYPFFSNIFFALLYGEIYYLQTPNIIFRIFSIFNPVVLIPAIIAYSIASNANFGKKLSKAFKTGEKSSKSTFNSKSYQKGKKYIRRKKRKLD